jgi:hypothetical protein
VAQSAGALVAIAPGAVEAVGRVAATVPAAERPAVTGHDYAFDVLGSVEALLSVASPTILDDVSKTFRKATASTSG